MKRLPLLLVGLALATTACEGRDKAPGASPLTIAAAADLRFALEELGPAFEKAHPQSRVTVSYGSSGNFYAQLLNGAPFDLFLSADVSYPRQLVDRGVAEADSEFTYAVGRIVLWAPGASALPVETMGLKVLEDPRAARIAIANPQHAPYGRAAEAAMRAAGILDGVRGKLVYGENVAQTLQFVESGSADLGIVALSLAKRVAGRSFLIPAEMHPAIEQGGAVLKGALHADAARTFRAFMMSSEGRAVLARYGLSPPEG